MPNSIIPQIKKVYDAASSISQTSDAQKQNLLLRLADLLIANADRIMIENQKDLDRMDDANPKKDRLLLTRERIDSLAKGLKEVVKLPDPTRIVLSEKTLENGLSVQKITAPMGVIGVIYESRPNVTIDVAALCIRSGNAVILRGGSDAENSNQMLVALIHQAMREFGIDMNALFLMPSDRKFVSELLTADRYVDMLIPRGSQALIDFVRSNATVPTIETGAGVCHTYVTSSADLTKAKDIVINAKTSRPSVCNALDTILIDQTVAADFLPMILSGMEGFEVEIFADEPAYQIIAQENYPYLKRAEESDFGREFLSYKCSVKMVKDYTEAMSHIKTYSSRHSEAIISEDQKLCEKFLAEVDAAAVFANASTRFTDGGVFGLGAEIGISTQKLHARGPFALEKLVTEKWIVRGNGQIR